MTTEQSKPIALDEREVHPIFCMFGRYGPSVALGIIVMLSVWGVFIILHRTVRGQRRKKDENSAGTVGRKALKTASEEESRSYIESTGRNIMDSVEEVSKAQPSSVEEPGEAKLLPGVENIPDLCNEEPDELDWSATGEPNSVSESHGHVSAHWNVHQEHVGNCSETSIGHPVLMDFSKHVRKEDVRVHWNDHSKHKVDFYSSHAHHENSRSHEEGTPDYGKSQKELVSKPEVHSLSQENVCEHQGSLLYHLDHNVENEKTMELLYMNRWQDHNSEGTRLRVMEESLKNDTDYLNDRQVRNHVDEHGDLLNDVSAGTVFQKIQGLDSNRNSRLEETWRVMEINVMETTVKTDFLTDYQYVSDHCEHSGNFHRHGFLKSCSERDNGRHQTLGDPSEEKAAGVISESKMKSLAGTMNQPPEHNFETTEINIMEATMENNEWMNVGSVEINKTISFPGKHLNGTAGMGDFGVGDNSDQSNLAKIENAKESGTIPALLDGDSSSKKVAAVQPMPQMVGVSFCVHYITHSPLQLIAVTGNQQELGNWEKFVPLKKAKDGFWANSIALPADCQVEWKFVLVENGEIHRWEECNNRHLLTGNEEDIHLHKWWGCI